MITVLKIDGMTCGHCVAAVKKALEGTPGVESADVVLAEGRATVHHAGDVAPLLAAVADEGYEAREA
jgi:copper chaperone